MTKLDTVNLQGKEYAQVSTRIVKFREDCPNGLIDTKPTVLDDGRLMFTARVLKDKARPESAEATGHAMGDNKGAKAFEKLETIAIGRALAMLGYMASGEVASSDEMEDFYAYREEQIDIAISKINASETIDDLKSVFMDLGSLMAESEVIKAKDARKAVLNAKA